MVSLKLAERCAGGGGVTFPDIDYNYVHDLLDRVWFVIDRVSVLWFASS